MNVCGRRIDRGHGSGDIPDGDRLGEHTSYQHQTKSVTHTHLCKDFLGLLIPTLALTKRSRERTSSSHSRLSRGSVLVITFRKRTSLSLARLSSGSVLVIPSLEGPPTTLQTSLATSFENTDDSDWEVEMVTFLQPDVIHTFTMFCRQTRISGHRSP